MPDGVSVDYGRFGILVTENFLGNTDTFPESQMLDVAVILDKMSDKGTAESVSV